MKAEDYALGDTVVCIASGPSLTLEDCEKVRKSGLPTIVTNTTYQMAPWADVLFGFDQAWWKYHLKELGGFKGKKVGYSPLLKNIGIPSLNGQPWFQHFGNSGTCAISLAIAGGAKTVILLGFDCQRTGGKVHFFGDHPKPLSNARTLDKWPQQFMRVAKYAASRKVMVWNATRETRLTCFAKKALEEALPA